MKLTVMNQLSCNQTDSLCSSSDIAALISSLILFEYSSCEAPVKAPAVEGASGTDALPSEREFSRQILKAMIFILSEFKIPMKRSRLASLLLPLISLKTSIIL